MNLIFLQEFLVLAETKSYSEAAERLYMNQSTLSKHIKALETELGVTLFDRSTRQVKITPFGEHLFPYARQIENLSFQYETELIQRTGKLLTIGTIPTMAEYAIIPLIFRFKERYPDLRVKIVEGDTLELKQGLLKQKYDLAFLRDGNAPFTTTDADDALLTKLPYQTDQVVAVVPAGHPFHDRESITLPELKGHRLCMLKEGTLLYEISVRACQAADFVPNIFFESHRISNILTMCIQGGSVALLLDQHLCDPATAQQLENHAVSVVKITPPISTTVSLSYLKKEGLSVPAKAFVNFFMNVKEDMRA
ncbi:MAG: LysR family transcriptional regulator [Oscillospiraceae bacterium]|nr:LysR family transcriptional regulator [Oscillospiraceae bacterium]